MNLYKIANRIRFVFLEKPKGIDFSISDSSFTTEGAQDNYYSRTDTSTLKQIKKQLNFTKTDALLDIGCGKGYVLYFFSNLEIGKLCGVEKYSEYCDIAHKNLHLLHIYDKAEIICCDAISFTNYSDFNIYFLFNPFREETADIILKKIVKSYASNPRKITVISVQDFLHNIIITNGFVETKVIVSKLTGVKTHVYSLNEIH